MKGITGHPALEAYQRFAIKPVSSAQQAQGAGVDPASTTSAKAAKVSISAERSGEHAKSGVTSGRHR
jgi:hypothetical protein